MKRFLTMYKIEQRIYFRSPDVILFGLLMPVVVFALITMISGKELVEYVLLLIIFQVSDIRSNLYKSTWFSM